MSEITQNKEDPTVERLKTVTERFFDWVQFLALLSIAFTAVFCLARELFHMMSSGRVQLGDLLLLFLYTEVIVMARAAMRSEHEVLIAMPMAIAVVAMARYMVVSPTHDPMHQILYCCLILILVIGLVLWYFRSWPHRPRNN